MKYLNLIMVKGIYRTRWGLVIIGLLLAILGFFLFTNLSNISAQGDGAEPTTEPTVEPTSSNVDDLGLKCLHDPIWPGATDDGATEYTPPTITIEAETFHADESAFSGSNTLESFDDQKIQIWFKRQENSEVELFVCQEDDDGCRIKINSLKLGTSIFYGCMIGDNGEVWSGWREVNIGLPKDQVSPSQTEVVRALHNIGNKDDPYNIDTNIDILFIRDEETYSDDFEDFIDDVHFIIEKAYYSEATFLQYQGRFNFWIATQPKHIPRKNVEDLSCSLELEDDYPFAEAFIVLHIPEGDEKDCASRNLRLFTGHTGNEKAVLHETGHLPFGLADEYSNENNSGYWELEESPNLYKKENLNKCLDRSDNEGTCQPFRDFKERIWYRLDSDQDDLMIGDDHSYTAQQADKDRIKWYLEDCSIDADGDGKVDGCPKTRIIISPQN